MKTAMTTRMNPYEREVLNSLRAWTAEPPAITTQWAGKAAGPAGKALQAAVPAALLRAAVKGLDNAAERFSGRATLLRAAGVSEPGQLRDVELEICDALAVKVQRRAMAIAGGTGALLGIAGAVGLVADVPALVAQALRGIRRIGTCYGEDGSAEEMRRLTLGVFALASATSATEKAAALDAIRNGSLAVEHAGLSDSMERAAQRELAKEAAVLSLTNIARGVGKNLGWRKAAAGVLPGIGALVGGSVNAWYLHDVTSTARYVFQERWLLARHPRLAV